MVLSEIRFAAVRLNRTVGWGRGCAMCFGGAKRRLGFSLLEVLIVLLILVGALAIVWPSLTGAIATSDLRQAAVQLRSELADARSQAILSGEPVLVRIDVTAGVVSYGPWREMLQSARESSLAGLSDDPFGAGTYEDDELAFGADLEAEGDSEGGEGLDAGDGALSVGGVSGGGVSGPWQLPPGVAFTVVRRGDFGAQRLGQPAFEDESLAEDDGLLGSGGIDFGRPLEDDSAGWFGDDSNQMDGDDSLGVGEPLVRWLWFLPQGEPCDAQLQLVDTRTRRWLNITLNSWSGGITVGRAQRWLDPEEFTDESSLGEMPLEDSTTGGRSGGFAGTPSI